MFLWRRMSIFSSDINRSSCSSHACIHVWIYPAAFNVYYSVISLCLCGLVFTQPNIPLPSSWVCVNDSQKHEQLTGKVQTMKCNLSLWHSCWAVWSPSTLTLCLQGQQQDNKGEVGVIGKRLSHSSIHCPLPSTDKQTQRSPAGSSVRLNWGGRKASTTLVSSPGFRKWTQSSRGKLVTYCGGEVGGETGSNFVAVETVAK